MSDTYWDKVWHNPNLKEYEQYLIKYLKAQPDFLKIFKEHQVKYVCDAACGFGAYSVLLASNGYRTAGFVIAAASVKLTCLMLEKLNIDNSGYIISDIANISFPSKQFDAVIAHAVIDHLPTVNTPKAIDELLRIVKDGGLVYLSFDGLEDDDIKCEHSILEDGSFLYTGKGRKGLLFKYYTDEDINNLLEGENIIYRGTDAYGGREIIIQK